MTPRAAGTVTGVVAFVALTGLAVVVTAARNADPASFSTDAAGLVSVVVITVLPIAIAAALLASAVAGRPRGLRAAVTAALVAYGLLGAWTWWLSTTSPRSPEEDSARYALELVQVFVQLGSVFAIATATVAWWIACHATGDDAPDRTLTLATTSLRGSRDIWGTAMRAELASIDDHDERRRFARSAASVALRRGTGRSPLVLAAATGVVVGIVTFAASRASFDRPGDGARGIIGEPLLGLVPLALVVAVLCGTLLGRSFRAGIETTVLAWLAAYACMLAVEIPEAMRWFDDERVLLLDGERLARGEGERLDAALEPITHWAFTAFSVTLLVLAMLAAALGAAILRVARRRRAVRAGEPSATPPASSASRTAGQAPT